jgi:hypothetical protein
MGLRDWIAGKIAGVRGTVRNSDEFRSATQSWAKTVREPEFPAVAGLARQIVEASLKDAEALKAFIDPTDEKDAFVCLYMTVCEFLYFFLHLTNRFAYAELGHEARCKVQEELYPLIIRPVIESILGDWPADRKKRLQGEFIQSLNNSELEYGECKKLVNSDNPYAGDALFSKFADRVCETICGEKIETKRLLDIHPKATQLAFDSFKALNLSETLRLIDTGIRNKASQGVVTGRSPSGLQADHDYLRLPDIPLEGSFTEEENNAVSSYLNMVQDMADEEMMSRAGEGAHAMFHPETHPIYQGLGLADYADKVRGRALFETDERERHKLMTKIINALTKAVSLSGFPILIYDLGCAVEAAGDTAAAKRLFGDFLERNRLVKRTSMYEIYLKQRNLKEAVSEAEKKMR